MHSHEIPSLAIGWREWVSLPALGIPAIKVKTDTGAFTSALHTEHLEVYKSKGMLKVRFLVYPLQQRKDIQKECLADIVDQRYVTNSGGHRELRYIIRTPIRIAEQEWDIEITLASREQMRFGMLLGRNAIAHRVIIDPGASYLTGKTLAHSYEEPKKKITKKLKTKKQKESKRETSSEK